MQVTNPSPTKTFKHTMRSYHYHNNDMITSTILSIHVPDIRQPTPVFTTRPEELILAPDPVHLVFWQ